MASSFAEKTCYVKRNEIGSLEESVPRSSRQQRIDRVLPATEPQSFSSQRKFHLLNPRYNSPANLGRPFMLNLKGNKITYFGHSTFSLIAPSGEVALIDPWVMTNPRCPDSLKKISRLDYIFLTHGHEDHFGDLLDLANRHHPKIVAIFEICMWLANKGLGNDIAPMSKGGTQRLGPSNSP